MHYWKMNCVKKDDDEILSHESNIAEYNSSFYSMQD
jgi:hypothetical protein